jgi:hypothetical protein
MTEARGHTVSESRLPLCLPCKTREPSGTEEILRFGARLALAKSLATHDTSKQAKSQEPNRSKTMKINAKNAIRIMILAAGVVGMFVAGNIQPVSVADGGPILTCPPGQTTCKTNLPPFKG